MNWQFYWIDNRQRKHYFDDTDCMLLNDFLTAITIDPFGSSKEIGLISNVGDTVIFNLNGTLARENIRGETFLVD